MKKKFILGDKVIVNESKFRRVGRYKGQLGMVLTTIKNG